MICLLTGNPGSGKTYMSVVLINDLLKNPQNVILSNIDNFRFERWKIIYKSKNIDNPFFEFKHGEYVDISNDIAEHGRKFFENEFQKEYLKEYLDSGKKVIYFIDECQRYLDHNLKSTDIIFFFDYHRHYGIDIYLITQSSIKLHRSILPLIEYEDRAIQPSLTPTSKHFVYKRLVDGTVIKRFIKKHNPLIFGLYTSFKGHNQKVKSVMFLYAFMLFAVLFGVFGFIGVISNLDKLM